MPDENLVLWVDLETDGTPEQHIIEIGCILTDQTPEFNEIGQMTTVVRPPWAGMIDPREGTCGMIGMQEHVRQMHLDNGLWDDVMACGDKNRPAVIEDAICGWLDAHGATKTHIPLAGSGVAHFDSRILAQHMPNLRERLTYYALDIGAVRRFVHEVKGLPWLGTGRDAEAEKPHRALDDIALHLEEARWFLANVRIPG